MGLVSVAVPGQQGSTGSGDLGGHKVYLALGSSSPGVFNGLDFSVLGGEGCEMNLQLQQV